MAWIMSIAFSPDGQTLASGSGDKTIKLWNMQTGKLHRTLEGHSGPVWSVAYAPSAGVQRAVRESHRATHSSRSANSPNVRLLASSGGD